MAVIIFLAAGIMFFSAILAMAEASLFSYSLTKARLRVAEGSWTAIKALRIREKPLHAIATFVVLSTTLNIGGSIAIGSLAAAYFSSRGIGVFSGILTLCTIIFAEVIPKNMGEQWNHKIFPIVAVPLEWFSIALFPLVWVLEKITKPFTTGASPFTTSEEEIILLSDTGAREGTIEPGEAEMIQRIFRFNDITAGDMMTPRPFVTFLDGDKTIGEVANFIKELKHSRLPVFQGDTNNILGMVHQRDLLRALANNELDQKVSTYAREALVVPDSRLADDLLRDFQEKRSHLGVVVSEYGMVVGVVGLEDVLEELVGEIIDEKDVAPELIKRVSKNEVIVHGQTKITSLNHFFNTNISSKKTLNGFLLEKFGQIPDIGEHIEVGDLILRVEEATARNIERVRIIKKGASPGL